MNDDCFSFHPIDHSLSPSHKWLLSNPTLATITMHKRPVKLSAESKMPKRCAYGTCKSCKHTDSDTQNEAAGEETGSSILNLT